MKCIVSFVLCAAATFAADFNTGQAARAVVGQPQFTRQDASPNQSIIGGASGVAFANNMLFVADSNRVGATPSANRVLIFPDVSGLLKTPTSEWDYTQRCPVCVGTATVVLGQKDFT